MAYHVYWEKNSKRRDNKTYYEIRYPILEMAIFKESLEHRGNLNVGNWDNVTRKETVRMEETKKRKERKKQELTK